MVRAFEGELVRVRNRLARCRELSAVVTEHSRSAERGEEQRQLREGVAAVAEQEAWTKEHALVVRFESLLALCLFYNWCCCAIVGGWVLSRVCRLLCSQ
jgi:hypothetical protein